MTLARLMEAARLDEPQTLLIMGQLLAALAYIRARGVVHRDVKPENILVHAGTAKLADFGNAGAWHPGRAMSLNRTTLWWRAPEVLRFEHYAFAADAWAAGVVMLEMANGRLPWGPECGPREDECMLAAILDYLERVWRGKTDTHT